MNYGHVSRLQHHFYVCTKGRRTEKKLSQLKSYCNIIGLNCVTIKISLVSYPIVSNVRNFNWKPVWEDVFTYFMPFPQTFRGWTMLIVIWGTAENECIFICRIGKLNHIFISIRFLNFVMSRKLLTIEQWQKISQRNFSFI